MFHPDKYKMFPHNIIKGKESGLVTWEKFEENIPHYYTDT